MFIIVKRQKNDQSMFFLNLRLFSIFRTNRTSELFCNLYSTFFFWCSLPMWFRISLIVWCTTNRYIVYFTNNIMNIRTQWLFKPGVVTRWNKFVSTCFLLVWVYYFYKTFMLVVSKKTGQLHLKSLICDLSFSKRDFFKVLRFRISFLNSYRYNTW